MIVVKADASEILPRLYQGAHPSPGHWLRASGVHVLVLCAEELQPVSGEYPGVHVIHCPFDDTLEPLPRRTHDMIFGVATEVARKVGQGKRVMVCCRQGRNRSGLVNGIAMTMITGCSGLEAVSWIRKHRLNALTNTTFATLISRIPSRRRGIVA